MSFEIDLSNPAELAAKMPELRRLYVEKVQQRADLEEQIRLLARLIGSAAATGLAGHGEPGSRPRRRRAAPAQERAARALEAAGGLAMSPTSLYKFMLAHGLDE